MRFPKMVTVWFDQHMKMSDHIGKICSKALYSLYNLRQIRKCLKDEACKTLVLALVTCHVDYFNALLHDVSQYQQQRLQRVLNAAARLICRLSKVVTKRRNHLKPPVPEVLSTARGRIFAKVSEEEIVAINEAAVPENTKKAIKFSLSVFTGR